MRQLLEHRQDVGDGADLLIGDQDVGILDDGLHAVGVRHEVGRDVALVELHALDILRLEVGALALLDGDDAVAAHALHDLGDQVADLRVGGGDGGDLRDLFLALDGRRGVADVLDDRLHALLDALAQLHRVGAGGEVPEALIDDGLRQHGGGGGAVAGHVVGLGGGFLQQLCAHVLEGIFERDLFGDGDAVVGNPGWS